MLTGLTRLVGFVVVVGLAVVGADRVFGEVFMWRKAYDESKKRA